MAALPENNTPRFRINYTVGSNQHSFLLRSAASPAFIGGFVDDLLTALASAIYGMVIDNVEFSASGSTVFNPVTTGIEGNPYGAGVSVGESEAFALNFIGRSTGGRRVRIMIFSPTTLGADYRFVAGEGGSIDAAVAVLQSSGGLLQAIDGLTPIWKTYVNALVNTHWQKALRP